MMDRKTIAALAAAGALGIGAWWFLFRDADEDEGLQDRDTVLGPDLSNQYTDNDKGQKVTGQTQSRDGVLIPSGARHYRWGNTVTVVNQPPFFGVESYRRTRCVPTGSVLVEPEKGEGAWQVMGRARRQSDTRNGWAWNELAVQRGAGFQNNGASIVARSWSCSPNFTAGRNNDNCRAVQPTRPDLLGFKPIEAEYDELWAAGKGSKVPFIEWNEPGGSGDETQASIFPGIDTKRATDKAGFISDEGRLWIYGGASRNFGMIQDADKDVKYLYSVRGNRGARTAVRVGPGGSVTYVKPADLKPVWVSEGTSRSQPALTHREFVSFRVNDLEAKNDPWLHEPFKTIDEAGRFEGSFGGRNWDIDYRIMDRGNPQFRRLIADVNERYRGAYGGGSGRVLLSYRNAYLWRNRSSPASGKINWPVVNYGLINPFMGVYGEPNALPFDFAAPVWINKWYDMIAENPGFAE